MGNGTIGWITVLLRLPVFYNPDAVGYRAPVEDDKFLDTAGELPTASAAARSSAFAMILRVGSGGITALSTGTCWH